MKRIKTRSPAARPAVTRHPFVLCAIAAAATCAASVECNAETATSPRTTSTDAPDAKRLAQAQRPASDSRAQASAASEPVLLETITVTASKREERLIDAPTAITAIGAEKLESLGVNSFSSYASLVPNLNQVGGQAPGQGSIVMRGLFTGAAQITNTTAFYLGETPFSASGAVSAGGQVTPDPDLVDIARVEVLKGPQGTLYGASSLGGVIRLIPRASSTNDLYGSVRLGANRVSDGGDGYSGKVLLNLPVAQELLGLQVGGFKRQDGGFTKNVTTGRDNLGETQAEGGTIAALLTPAAGLAITLRGLTQRLDSNGPAYEDDVLGTGTPVTGEREFAYYVELPTKAKYDLAELNTEYEFGAGTITATVGHAQSRLERNLPAETYALFLGGRAPPGLHARTNYPVENKKDSAEVRFASKRLAAFEFLAGAFYTKERNLIDAHVLGELSTGVPVAAPFNNILRQTIDSKYEERAVFGNATYYLTDTVDLSAGVRYAKNDQDGRITRAGLVFIGIPSQQSLVSSENSTTYQLTARWRVANSFSTYARLATGYRPGGPQVNPTPPPGTDPFYKPDTVTNYELGVKGTGAGGRLGFDVAVYHIDWKDVQLNSRIGNVTFTGNAGKATVDGIEVQTTYTGASGLSVGGSLGYNEAKLKEVGGSATAALLGATNGDSLPGSSKFTAAAYGDYRIMISGDTSANIGATLRHQGSKHTSYPLDPFNLDYEMPAYTTLDLRAGVQWGRYNLRFGVDNAANKNGITGYNTTRLLPTQNLPSQAFLIRPRTLTATFGVEF